MLTLDKKVLRNQHTAFRNMEDEGLVMDPATSSLHSLNEVGCAIWNFIVEQHTIAEIVDMLLQTFDCDREQATQDTLKFVQLLGEKKLATIE
jgi:hypothetical protein